MSSSISASLPSSSSSCTLPSEDSLSNKDIRQIVGFIRQQTAELEALKQAFENLQNTCVRYVSSDITLFGQSLRLRRKIKGTEVCVGKDRLYLSETNNIIYRGTTLEGKPHGQGVMTFPNGDHYEGAWINGEEHGQGKLTRQDGFEYTGIWANGTLDIGTGTYPDRDSYKGLLIDKKGCYEHGTLIRKDEFEYVGMLKNGEPHGKGTATFTNGDRYEGEWLQGKPCGKGMVDIVGDKSEYHYEGNITMPGLIANGEGTLTVVVDGEYEFDYKGCFKSGKMAGGTLKATLLNTDKDNKLPKGTYIFYNITDTLDSLDSFKGQIKASFANGDCYEGEWSMFKPNGQGIMVYANGERVEGLWVDGKLRSKTKF